MSLSQGDRLGRYEVLGPIGAGGMGEVWRARDTELDRQVAIKVLPEAVASEPHRVERFRREARALAALSHPNLLEIHDVGSTEGVDYVVTELLEGDSLRSAIPPSGLPWQKVAEIGAAVADGLAAAHGKGIVHRDLKPENLFVTSDGRVKILDFGLASMDEEIEVDGDSPTVTEAGAVLGTVGYMAPEQLRGRPADSRSDVFSLGCVLYEMASGRRAFVGATGVEIMAAILKEEPPQLSSSGAAVPVDLERTVHRCLEKRSEARFQSAADLAYNLKSLGSSQSSPVMATPSTVTSLNGRKRPRWAAPVVLVGVLLAALSLWWTFSERQARRAPVEGALNLNPSRIAVVPFANRSNDPAFDAIGRRIAGRIIEELSDIDDLETVPINVVAGSVDGRAPLGVEGRTMVNDVAAATSAGLVITGVLYSSVDEIELQATLENAITGRIVRGFDTLRTGPQDLDSAIGTLAGWIYVTTMEELHPSLRFGAGDRIPDPVAFREYVTNLRNLGIRSDAGEALTRALEIDPLFDRLRIFRAFSMWGADAWKISDHLLQPLEARRATLTRGQRNLVDGIRWGLDGRWGGALNQFQEYSAGHPEDCMAKGAVILAAVNANRPQIAIQAFNEFVWDPIFPSNAQKIAHFLAAGAHHSLSQHDAELAVIRQLWDEHQRFFGTIWYRDVEAQALAALGDIEGCRDVVATALTEPAYWPSRYGEMMVNVAAELRAHGHVAESRQLALRALDWFESTELPPDSFQHVQGYLISAFGLLGEHDQAYRLAVELLESQPDSWSYQANVGVTAARIGDRNSAEVISKGLAAGEAPFTLGGPSFARAAIAAQLGDRDEAIRLLRQAITRGFSGYRQIHVEISFDPIRDDPEFQEILRPKG